MTETIEELRQRLRAVRRALTSDEQVRRSQAAATIAATHLRPHLADPPTLAIAAYVPVQGELDPGPATTALQPTRVLLPVVTDQVLRFGDADRSMSRGRFGIPEPSGPTIDADALDVVLVPVVAVDLVGHRVGMGGGFYDRTFAPADGSGVVRRTRPLLVAFAHDEQLVDRLAVRPWDVPMDAVLTPTRFVAVSV